MISKSVLDAVINEYVLNERDRYILKRRMIDGIKIESLAEEAELSVSQIKRILRKWSVIFDKCDR